MGRASKAKGARVEREVVARLTDAGIAAVKVPLSGACGGSYSGDIRIGGPMIPPWIPAGEDPHALIAEVKARKDGKGWKVIERWFGDKADVLILKRNLADPLVVLRWSVFLDLLGRDV